MGRTINRIPYTVNVPSSNDIKQYTHNHYTWKGIADMANFVTVDVDTFEDAVNVYMDKDCVLRSRPSIKPFELKYYDNGEEKTLSHVQQVFETVKGNVYYGDGFLLIDEDHNLIKNIGLLLPDYTQFKDMKIIATNDVLIIFEATTIYSLDLETDEVFVGLDAVYIPEQIGEQVENDNSLTDSRTYLYVFNFIGSNVDDLVYDADLFNRTYDVYLNDKPLKDINYLQNLNDINYLQNLINVQLTIKNLTDLYELAAPMDVEEILDVGTNAKGEEVVLFKNGSAYYCRIDNRLIYLQEQMNKVSLDGSIVYRLDYNGTTDTFDLVCSDIVNDNGVVIRIVTGITYYDQVDFTGPYVSVVNQHHYAWSMHRNQHGGAVGVIYLRGLEYLVLDLNLDANISGNDIRKHVNSYIYIYDDNYFLISTKWDTNTKVVGDYKIGYADLILYKLSLTDEQYDDGVRLKTHIDKQWTIGRTNLLDPEAYLIYDPKNLRLNDDVLTFRVRNTEYLYEQFLDVRDTGTINTYQININEDSKTLSPIISLTDDDLGYHNALGGTGIGSIVDINTSTSYAWSGSMFSIYSNFNTLTIYPVGRYDPVLRRVYYGNEYIKPRVTRINGNFYVGKYYYVKADYWYIDDELIENVYVTNNLEFDNNSITLKRTPEGTLIYNNPDLVKQLGNNILMVVDNKVYISEYRKVDDYFKLYFPSYNEHEFNDFITNIHTISNTEFAIFFENDIYYAAPVDTDGVSLYQYNKSKLDIGCTRGSDVITTFDGVYTLFASKRGLSYLSYQQFVASTDLTVTFLSDTINSRFGEFNTKAIKLHKTDYWFIIYKSNSNECYVFDIRTSGWWYWKLPEKITKIVTIDNEPVLLLNDTLHYFDMNEMHYYDVIVNNSVKHDYTIDWSFTSQKLFLNAMNNYKHIYGMTITSVIDSDEPLDFNLQCINYRDIENQIVKNSIEYRIDRVRTYVQRLNYPKVIDFQYTLSYNNEMYKDLQRPAKISNVSVKYKIGGNLR